MTTTAPPAPIPPASRPAPPLQVGQVLDGFRLEERLEVD